MRKTGKKGHSRKFLRDRRRRTRISPLADPHPEWPVHLTETRAYHNEPRNPYQSDDEDATQAFVQKYLELADAANANPISLDDDSDIDKAA